MKSERSWIHQRFVPVKIWPFFNVLMRSEYNTCKKRFEYDSFFLPFLFMHHQYPHSINFWGFCCQVDPKTEMFIEEGKLISNIIGTN